MDDLGGAAKCFYECPNCHTWNLDLSTGLCRECGHFNSNVAEESYYEELDTDTGDE